MRSERVYYLPLLASLLAFVVIVLGAYTRLTDSGLGCPDWPGCYGKVLAPQSQHQISAAQVNFPGAVVVPHKAKNEMLHRYVAGSLGVLILSLLFVAWRVRDIKLPLLIFGLVFFQAALGRYTVTLKLLPQVVMAHLLGGLTLLCLLWWLQLKWRDASAPNYQSPYLKWAAALAFLVVFAQIALGAWVSANYAGLACVGFPDCNGQHMPVLNFHKAFMLFSPNGVNYEGGVLDSTARITIQMVHRMGAIFTFVWLSVMGAWIGLSQAPANLKKLAGLMVILLLIQFTLGIINVTHYLPLWNAIAHNAVAALLLVTVLSINYFF